MQPQDILHFWFEELSARQHFAKDAALDAFIRARTRNAVLGRASTAQELEFLSQPGSAF